MALIGCCDSAFSGVEGKSTTGYRWWIQGVPLVSASKTQSLIALSPGEAEPYGINSAIAEGIFLRGLLTTVLGYQLLLQLWTDSSTAMGITSRIGVGPLKHLEVKNLWLQQIFRTQEVFLHFLPGSENSADLLTKNLDPATLQKHGAALGFHHDVT